jgi:hypothetical protein
MRSRDTISPCSVSRTGGIARHLNERGPCEQDDSRSADELMQYGDSARHPYLDHFERMGCLHCRRHSTRSLHRSYNRRICSDGHNDAATRERACAPFIISPREAERACSTIYTFSPY